MVEARAVAIALRIDRVVIAHAAGRRDDGSRAEAQPGALAQPRPEPIELEIKVPSGDIDNWLDTRPNRPRVAHSADVFVDAQGLIYVTDFNAGLHILEYKGSS